ncbi:NAD-binding Rossmann fold oxidoreductase [Crassisporium funariophilum]|nr:NAD-binding Rossmann fold oxidoreductase [Crassisporium funariophilum]
MSKPIRVGFVGLSATGWAATVLGPALVAPTLKDEYNLTAVSTTSDASSKASAQTYTKKLGHPVKAFFGDTSKIASDPDVDFVAVSVKAMFHKDAVLPVIEGKKPFFIEWPAGRSTEETVEIAEAARRQGVKSMVGLQGRHSRVIRKVKEIVSSGALGAIRSTYVVALIPREFNLWAPFHNEEVLYLSKKENGATLLQIPIGHQLDLITHVLGDFSKVSAMANSVYPITTVVDKSGKPVEPPKTFETTTPDHYAFTGVLKSGAMVNAFWRLGYKSTEGRTKLLWEIDGEEGTIRIESDGMMAAMTSMQDPDLYLNGKKVDLGEGEGGSLHNVTEGWKEYAKGEEGEYATIEDAVKNHQLLDAIQRSYEEGKTVNLD